jgi:hypothetical protein
VTVGIATHLNQDDGPLRHVAGGTSRCNSMPMSVLRGAGTFSPGWGVVNAVRNAVIRLALSRANRIRVSAMSEAWLRTHVAEYDKHRSDLLR